MHLVICADVRFGLYCYLFINKMSLLYQLLIFHLIMSFGMNGLISTDKFKDSTSKAFKKLLSVWKGPFPDYLESVLRGVGRISQRLSFIFISDTSGILCTDIP